MRLAAIHSLTDTPETAAGESVRPGLAGRLLAFVRGWLARRAVLAELKELDDRTLADLCLYPGDFSAIANGPLHPRGWCPRPASAAIAPDLTYAASVR